MEMFMEYLAISVVIFSIIIHGKYIAVEQCSSLSE